MYLLGMNLTYHFSGWSSPIQKTNECKTNQPVSGVKIKLSEVKGSTSLPEPSPRSGIYTPFTNSFVPK